MNTRNEPFRILRKFLGTTAAPTKSVNEIPRISKLPNIGSYLHSVKFDWKTQFHKYIDEQHKKLGPIILEKVGQADVVFINEPVAIRSLFLKYEGKYPQHVLPEPWIIYNAKHNCRRGLFFMDGEEWLSARRKMNNMLLKTDAESWIKAPVANVVDDVVHKWRPLAVSGFTPSLENELYNVSLQVMLSVMLGDKYKDSKKQMEDLINKFATEVQNIFLHTSKMYFFSTKLYSNWNLPTWKAFENSVTLSLTYGKQIIDEMFAMEDKGNGLLSKMLDENMNKEEIYNILVDFIIAAGDTTSLTTQWTLYLLAKHKLLINQIQQDIQENKNNSIKNAIKESMRLYPIAPFLTRILPEPAILLDYEIPIDSVVCASIYTNGRDPKYFPSPLSFRPSRWNRDVDQNNFGSSLHASLPFAIGARSCIGKKIAMEQMTSLISMVLENFDITLLNKTVIEDEMVMVLKPKDKINLFFVTKC